MTFQADNTILYEDLPTTTNPIGQFANGLRGALCAIHNNVPYAYSIPFENPLNDTVEDFWNGVCDRPSSPDGLRPGFGGGCPIDYNVSATAFNEIDGEDQTESWVVQGVQSAYWNPAASPPQPGANNIIIAICGAGTTLRSLSFAGNALGARKRITVSPLGTETANCCGFPPTVPPTPNVLPPEVTINLPDIGPVTIPVQFPEVNVDLGGNIIGFAPVIITPIGQFVFNAGGVSFNPRININPDITIPIGGSGTGGGVTAEEVQAITNNQTQVLSSDLADLLAQILGVLATIIDLIEALNFQCDLQPVLDLINCYFLELSFVEADVSIVSNSPGGTFNLPDNTDSVVMELVFPPTPQTRVQSGSGTAAQVFYWGWYSLNAQATSDGDRRELYYRNHSTFVPSGTPSITVNPIRGNRFNLVARTKTFTCNMEM